MSAEVFRVSIQQIRDSLQDVTPLEEGLADIGFVSYKHYNSEILEVLDYLRAIIDKSLYRREELIVTEAVIERSSTCFSAYLYRRKIFEKIGVSDEDNRNEIAFMEDLLPSNTKNFQIWEHRKFFVQRSRNYEKELDSIDRILSYDNKNYHAWVYRVWLCKEFNLFERELRAVEEFIEEDAGNNSAWSYRYFLHSHNKQLTQEDVRNQIQYCLGSLADRPDNEACWNYLFGFFQLYIPDSIKSNSRKNTFRMQDFDTLFALATVLLSVAPENKFANSLKIHHLLTSNKASSAREALVIMQQLASKYDVVRKNYWEWMASNVTRELENNKFIS